MWKKGRGGRGGEVVIGFEAKSIARRPRILARVEARGWSRRKREVRARGREKIGKRKSE